MNLEDELRDISPSISDSAVTDLVTEYGKSFDFTTGLKTIARIVKKDKLPAKNPTLYEPWRKIYVEMLANVMSGISVASAFMTAIQNSSPIAPALSEAVSLRIKAQDARLKQKQHTTDDYIKTLDDLGFNIRFNQCKNRVEVNGDLLTDDIQAEINLAMMDQGFIKRSVIGDAVLYAASKNKYHPVRDYLRSLHWDGHQHIEKLAGYFKVEKKQQAMFPSLLRKWLVGAVYKIFDGTQNPMLVFDGLQGCGKSTFARWLCPLKEYYRESSIDPDDKDCKIDAAGTWLWEVGELGSTTRRADREALKNFLTINEFSVRGSYERNTRKYTSMASFIGTINNESGFLDDPTGARRFWIVSLQKTPGAIDFSYANDLLPEDIWAEAYMAYTAGESHSLDQFEADEMLDTTEEYKTISATEEAIKRWFIIDPTDKTTFTPFTEIRSILEDPNKGNLKGNELDARRIAAALKSLGLEAQRQYVPQSALGFSKSIRVRGYCGLKPL